VYIAWGEHGPGAIIEVLFRRSTDGEATFERVVNLSNDNGDSYYPNIAVLENKVYVLWNDNSFGDLRFSIEGVQTTEVMASLGCA
jgi:hypothetical protein